jgi:hypothetical protein
LFYKELELPTAAIDYRDLEQYNEVDTSSVKTGRNSLRSHHHPLLNSSSGLYSIPSFLGFLFILSQIIR